MKTGEQCQICGNDYDPMRSCSCRWAPLADATHLAHDIVAALRFHDHPITKQAADEIEHMRKWLKEVKLLTAAYADNYEGWPLVASIHRAARVGLKETS